MIQIHCFNVNLVSLKKSPVDHGRLLFMCDHFKDNVNLVTVLFNKSCKTHSAIRDSYKE